MNTTKQKQAGALVFNKLEQGWPTYSLGKITSAYELEDGSKIGYCAATREWLKWSPSGELHSSFRKTRKAAAEMQFRAAVTATEGEGK